MARMKFDPSSAVQTGMYKVFYRWGHFVGRRPLLVILVSFALALLGSAYAQAHARARRTPRAARAGSAERHVREREEEERERRAPRRRARRRRDREPRRARRLGAAVVDVAGDAWQ